MHIEDRVGNIWFGSSDGVVSVYEKSKHSFQTYNLSERLSLNQKAERGLGLPHVVVNGILQDDTGRMMIATTSGLVTVDQAGSAWHAFTSENSPLPEGSITAIMKDKSGRIWLGTSEGILVLGA